MATRHIIIAIVFGVAIGLIMYYVLGGNPLIHMAIAIVGALFGAWFGTRRKQS
ncbi:MAG: hypothetical protein VYD64_11635 [Pseudomonadota bacterium]|nr:hypothetical protein [Pseudomonadota bacterium]